MIPALLLAVTATATASASSTATIASTATAAASATQVAAPEHYTFPALGGDTPAQADPLRYAPYVGMFEGAGSIGLTIGWAVAARSWDAPYPDGLVGLATARVLYGTSWSLMLAADVALLRLVVGEDWRGISDGRYSDLWLGGYAVPARFGSGGHFEGVCGGGVGSFSEVSASVYRAGPLSIRAALFGGWIMGRYIEDDLATRAESTWMLAPLAVLAEVPLELGPVKLTLALGPGLYGGLHDAHAHPKNTTRAALDIPFTELFVLHGGVGPGVHGSARLSFFDVVSLEADAELALLLLGGTNEDVPEVLYWLDAFRWKGVPTWRRASVGVGLSLPPLRPLHLSVRYWLAQLSPGPIDELGHRAFGLELAIPMDFAEP